MNRSSSPRKRGKATPLSRVVEALPRLTDPELRCYLVVEHDTRDTNQPAPISYNDFVTRAGIHGHSTISHALAALEQKGLLERLRQESQDGRRQIVRYRLRSPGSGQVISDAS